LIAAVGGKMGGNFYGFAAMKKHLILLCIN